jgi:hypothetical protein
MTEQTKTIQKPKGLTINKTEKDTIQNNRNALKGAIDCSEPLVQKSVNQ